MNPLRQYLEADHRQITALLARSIVGERIDPKAYEALRARLLRHIGIEEKIVFAAAKEAQGGVPLALARALRVEHGAIASLLVPPPDADLVRELGALLARHERLEEDAGGAYDACDRLLVDRLDELADAAATYPEVPTARLYDGPGVPRTAERALALAERMRFGRDDR